VICVEAEASETTTRGFAPKKPIKRVEGSGQLEIKNGSLARGVSFFTFSTAAAAILR
jgi:hypothetical protein